MMPTRSHTEPLASGEGAGFDPEVTDDRPYVERSLTGGVQRVLHGSCPACHHYHNKVVVVLSPDPNTHVTVTCENCNRRLFAIGGNSTHSSLMSQLTLENLGQAEQTRRQDVPICSNEYPRIAAAHTLLADAVNDQERTTTDRGTQTDDLSSDPNVPKDATASLAGLVAANGLPHHSANSQDGQLEANTISERDMKSSVKKRFLKLLGRLHRSISHAKHTERNDFGRGLQLSPRQNRAAGHNRQFDMLEIPLSTPEGSRNNISIQITAQPDNALRLDMSDGLSSSSFRGTDSASTRVLRPISAIGIDSTSITDGSSTLQGGNRDHEDLTQFEDQQIAETSAPSIVPQHNPGAQSLRPDESAESRDALEERRRRKRERLTEMAQARVVCECTTSCSCRAQDDHSAPEPSSTRLELNDLPEHSVYARRDDAHDTDFDLRGIGPDDRDRQTSITWNDARRLSRSNLSEATTAIGTQSQMSGNDSNRPDRDRSISPSSAAEHASLTTQGIVQESRN